MSTIPNLSASMEEPPSRVGTVGIEKECVDPYTLQMIDQLFPGHHGIQFLAGILRQASVKQLALPELALPEATDVAVITVQSIRTLARLIGFSYDTTEKYIVVLCQLRLLHKKRYRRQIILHFPLCRCQVPDPGALESLDYRPKVTSFAGQVKRRIVLLRTSGRTLPPSPSLTVVQGDAPRLAPRLVEDIRQILQQEVDSETGSRLLLRIEGAVRYRCTQSQSRLLDGKGDSLTGGISQERRLREQKGDFLIGKRASIASESPFSRQKDDFQAAGAAASLNDNVITLSNDSTLMDDVSDNDAAATIEDSQDHYSSGEAAKVGRQLALFLEKSPQNTGGFVNKCKQCSRTVIRASVIDVLVHAAFPQVDPADERGRPKNRASWFHDACKKYAKSGTRIPAFIEKWLRTDLSWQEIERQLNEAALRYKRYMTLGPGTADLVRQWLRGEIEQPVLDEALQESQPPHENPSQLPLTPATPAANGLPLVTTSSSQSPAQAAKTWMDEDEAEALAEEILRDAGPLGVSKAVAKQEHGVYVVMLTWGGTTFPMKTPQQWRAHIAKVRPHFEAKQWKGENNGTTQ